MKKIGIGGVAIVLGLALFLVFNRKSSTGYDANTAIIGILQTASHPALDAVSAGFIHELKDKMGDKVAFVVHNAQGSVDQAYAIAQQFHANKKYKGFLAIATPAAQALAAVETERPIFIAAVTDPRAIGITEERNNIAGVNDMIDVKAEVAMLTQLIPEAKRVALLYTSGETNSLVLVKQMRYELEALGIQPIDCAITDESTIPLVVDSACRKADAILAPTDNSVASAIVLIAGIAQKYRKPLIVSDTMLVRFGALASRGVDYQAIGTRVGQQAYALLNGHIARTALQIERAPDSPMVVNKATLDRLGITIPAALQTEITFVDGE